MKRPLKNGIKRGGMIQREAFGVRPACRRYRASRDLPSSLTCWRVIRHWIGVPFQPVVRSWLTGAILLVTAFKAPGADSEVAQTNAPAVLPGKGLGEHD